MIVVTAATGHLGRLVVEELLKNTPAEEIAVAVRNPEKAADLATRGVDVRYGDYEKTETLAAAFRGATKLLLISSSEVGKRVVQHRNAIEAAKAAGVSLLAYTSIPHADRSPLALAREHAATEELIRASGIPYVFLRNGWYTENYTEHLAVALEHGAIVGSSGDGRVAAAARVDYAAAAAAVLTGSGHEGKAYELAGDVAFSMAELAAEVSRQSGKTVVYKDLPPDAYKGVLAGAGLPPEYAELLVDASVGVGRGELDLPGDDLRSLTGRPSTPLADSVRAALG